MKNKKESFDLDLMVLSMELDLDTTSPIEFGKHIVKAIKQYEREPNRTKEQHQMLRKVTSGYVGRYGMTAWNSYVKKPYESK